MTKMTFSVDWSNSGGSSAVVRVTCGGKEVSCTMKSVKKGLHVCAFTPRQVGLHLIDVMIDGMLLPGTVSELNWVIFFLHGRNHFGLFISFMR